MDAHQFKLLEHEVSRIFSLSIEPHLAFHQSAEDLNSSVFYERLYVSRQGEDQEFMGFLQGSKTILVITGHVGVGKSTFIREKYQHKRCCAGITVDLKQRQPTSLTSGDLGENLKQMVGHAVKDRLLANFRNAVACSRGADAYADPSYDIAIYPEAAVTGEPSPDDHAMAELHLATLILARDDFLKSDALSAVRTKYSADVPLRGIPEKREKFEENLQRANVREAITDVFGATKYREWLRCYQLVFGRSLPLVVVVDNSDVLDTKLAGGKVYEPIVEMEGYLNHWDEAQIAAGYTLPNVKFVFAVRDENIALINTFGRRPQHMLQLSLGPEDISIPYVDAQQSLSTTDEFISKIIERRLEFLAERIRNVPEVLHYFRFFRKIFEWWFAENEVGGRAISNRLSQINIVTLNNRSIAQIMEHISQASLQMLQTALWCGIEINEFDDGFANIGLRGRVFRAAWAMNNVRKLNVHWRSEFERKTTEPYISLSRLLLTRLVNHKQSFPREGRTVQSLQAELCPFFPGLNIEQVKDALYALYESSVGQSELIAIQQGDYVACGADIRSDSKVFAMPRGIELIDRVLIQIDFFGEMLSDRQAVPQRLQRRKILMEMTPNEALDYIGSIYKLLVVKMARSYESAWKEVFCPALRGRKTVSGGFRPFAAFQSCHFAYNNAFYIERCCASHISSIKSYLRECLRAERCRLLLSQDEKSELMIESDRIKSTWSAEQKSVWAAQSDLRYEPDDILFRSLLVGSNYGSAIVKIWKISEQYATILNSFRAIRMCDEADCKIGCLNASNTSNSLAT